MITEIPPGLRFRPIRWADMPMSARKCFTRLRGALTSDGEALERGVEWFVTFSEPSKFYLRTREWRWFVGEKQQ